MDKKYYIDYLTENFNIKFYLRYYYDDVVLIKRSKYGDYIYLIQSENGICLDVLINNYKSYNINFKINPFMDEIELLNEYKQKLRSKKMENLLNE